MGGRVKLPNWKLYADRLTQGILGFASMPACKARLYAYRSKGFLGSAITVCRVHAFQARLYAYRSKGFLGFATIVCRVMPLRPGCTQKAWPTTFCLRLAPSAAGEYHRMPPCLTTADQSELTAACLKVTRCVLDRACLSNHCCVHAPSSSNLEQVQILSCSKPPHPSFGPLCPSP